MKMRVNFATSLVALSIAISATSANAANLRLAENCLFNQASVCSGGSVTSTNGQVTIKVTSVGEDGAVKYSYNGKKYTARGACPQQSTPTPVPKADICDSKRSSCEVQVVGTAQAAPTLKMEAKRFDIPNLAIRLPVTKEGQCYLVGVAKGMSLQGAIRMGSIYCPKVENGRAYWDVQRLEMALTDNAWTAIISAALNGFLGDVASAGILANASGSSGGGYAAAASVAESSVNIYQSATGSYGSSDFNF